MLGKFLITIAFLSSIISMVCFFFAHRGNVKLFKTARIFFHITSISIITASVVLLYLILTHQFQYAYVWEQSSTDLQLPLLLSTFFAGQEGSFLLWAFFTAVMGIYLLNYVSKGNRLEAQVMIIFTLVLSFLTLILILKTPFNYVWESFPKEVEFGFAPPEGRGLNPLLQNFWMSIHPPILFLGFAALTVPFSFAIGALMSNKYDEWIKYSLPWTLFAGGILGLGIMTGGYWAYGVLGWGGYWGWDPVENSSLIPWIISVAGLHTMLAQKKTGGYKTTNLALNILAFLLVLYSTFLTRSGVLGDSSVHSFTDPGSAVYIALLLFISSFVFISVFAIVYRYKSLKTFNKTEHSVFLSKESFLFIGTLLLCASALVIFAGTSWPLVSRGKIEIDFYNRMNFPIIVVLMLTIGLGLYIDWKQTNTIKLLKNLILPFVLSVAVLIILYLIGLRDPLYIVLAFTSLFAFFVNVQFSIRIIKSSKLNLGGKLAHIGLALFFLGVIGSGKYSQETNLSLEMKKPIEALGYTFTYTGLTPFFDANNKRDTMYYFNINVEKDNKEMVMRPVMYHSQFTNGIMKNPDMKLINFATDLYISPMSLEQPPLYKKEQVFDFKKGEIKKVGDLSVQFEDFDFGKIQKGGKEMLSGNYSLSAVIIVDDGTKRERISAKTVYKDGEPEPVPVQISGNSRYSFMFINMEVKGDEQGGSQAKIAILDASKSSNNNSVEETLVVSAAVKPFIDVVWVGVVILFAGFVLSMLMCRKELDFNLGSNNQVHKIKSTSVKKGNGKKDKNRK